MKVVAVVMLYLVTVSAVSPDREMNCQNLFARYEKNGHEGLKRLRQLCELKMKDRCKEMCEKYLSVDYCPSEDNPMECDQDDICSLCETNDKIKEQCCNACLTCTRGGFMAA